MADAVTVNEGCFNNARGQRLFTLEVLPPPGESARCVIVWAHEHGQHSRRTLPAFRLWASRGIAVFAFDFSGMGASEPSDPKLRHLVGNLSHMIDDMADFAASIAKRHRALAQLPAFAGGAGIGGVIAALTVLRWQDEWRGLALFAPAVGAQASAAAQVSRLFAPLFDMALSHARVALQVAPERLNSDPAEAAALRGDPLCARGPSPVRTAFQYSRAQAVLERSAPRLTLPVYVEHPTGDLVERWQDSREFAASVGSEDVAWIETPGGCHDELAGAGPRAAAAAARIADWLLRKAAEASSAGKGGAGGGAAAAPPLRTPAAAAAGPAPAPVAA